MRIIWIYKPAHLNSLLIIMSPQCILQQGIVEINTRVQPAALTQLQ